MLSMDQGKQQSRPDASARMACVERAWLEAARNGNVDQLKILRKQHPKWLDLQRTVDDVSGSALAVGPDESRSSRSTRFCSWDGFHLDTIGASALHTATWYGGADLIQYLLEEGQDPDTGDDTGTTPIMLAIMHHNLQATRCVFRDRLAVQRNLVTDCHQEDDERSRCTIERIQQFLLFNANVDKQCLRGKTALHHATTDETYEVAKLLLMNGARIDIQDEEGKSPLYDCIQSASMLVVDLLLQHGAQLHLPDKDGVTPLQLIVRTHDVNMLQIVLNHHQLVPTSAGEDFAGSVFLFAVDEGALPIVRFLLEECYVSVDFQNLWGETAMHRAIMKQRGGVAEFLRSFHEAARVLTFKTTSGDSCLHYAAQFSNSEELRLLLGFYRRWYNEIIDGDVREEGDVIALSNDVNSDGHTALFVTATSTSDSTEDRNEKAQLLVDVGAKLLGNNPFLEVASQSVNTMELSSEVQRCLNVWASECAEFHPEDVTKFCMKYLTLISPMHHRLALTQHVLEVLVSSGYAVDMTPLVLLLPFERTAAIQLLEHIGEFGRRQSHPLIQTLYEELVAWWVGLIA